MSSVTSLPELIMVHSDYTHWTIIIIVTDKHAELYYNDWNEANVCIWLSDTIPMNVSSTTGKPLPVY